MKQRFIRVKVTTCPICGEPYQVLNLHTRYLTRDWRVLRHGQIKGAGPVLKTTTHEAACAKKHGVDLWLLKDPKRKGRTRNGR